MVEAARSARLGDEARRGALVAQEVGMNDLHRDGASQRPLLGAVDPTHAADAHEIEDHVAAGQRAVDEGVFDRCVPVSCEIGKPQSGQNLMCFVARVAPLGTGSRHRYPSQVSMRKFECGEIASY